MIKIFNAETKWPTKVNFVDERNVMLGFDLEDQCCETVGWFLSDTIIDRVQDTPGIKEIPEYYFDTLFYKEFYGKDGWTSFVVFRMLHESREKELFLHLYNTNAMYSHGFEFADDGIIIKQEKV